MQKNGYTSRDVSKAISGFCIILALIATLSLFSGIGKGGSSTTPGNSDGTSSGTVTGSGSGGTVEPVQDELAGIWVFNNTPEWIGEDITFNVDFSLNGASYSSIVFSAVYEGNTLPTHTGNLMSYGDTPAYFWKVSGIPKYFEGWQFDNYRAISITSKLAEVENGEKLLAYLQANAQKQNTSATEIIIFTIEETPYQAWAGMTWGEWCDSDFDFNDIYSEEFLKIIENGDINHAVSTNGVLVDILPSTQITANGEYKLTGYPEELPVWNGTDLTGTTWHIPAGWTATAGYGIFYVDFTYSGETFSEMHIGYNGGTSESNYITIAEGKSNVIYLSSSSELSFTFNEGTDTSLIAWLKVNGELTSHQMPTPTLISFTVDGTTYQAEEGMTWAEWCVSDYNSLGVYVSGNYVVGSTTSGYYICSNVDTSYKVLITDTIEASKKYYLTNTPHSTGGSN